jgi:hypothetical protein
VNSYRKKAGGFRKEHPGGVAIAGRRAPRGRIQAGGRDRIRRNQGYWNQGYWNQGYWNQGYWNQGYWNQGYWNHGYWNHGYWNNGSWNSALDLAKCREAVMVNRSLTMIKGTLPLPVFFDPPDR